MPFRLSSLLVAVALIAALLWLTTSHVFAQDTPACECTDRGSEVFHTPDTIFNVTKGFDVAFCGRIDRSLQPVVYSEFTMWSCGHVRDVLEVRGALQECHLYVSRSMFIVEALALLPTGADMHLARRPCWRTEHRLFVAEDSSAFAIAGPITELIATFQKPTPEQLAQVQRRFEAVRHSIHWTDQELLGQVFLCALFDGSWASRFQDLREMYLLGGSTAELYDEFLRIFHDKRAGTAK
jgi:hypothetical protein